MNFSQSQGLAPLAGNTMKRPFPVDFTLHSSSVHIRCNFTKIVSKPIRLASIPWKRWNIPFKIPPDEISMKWFNLNNLEPKKILPIELRSAGGTFNRCLFIELGGISSSSRSAAKMLEGAGISRVLQPRNTRKYPSQATPLGSCFVTLCLSGGNASRKGNSFIRPQRQ